MMTAVCNRSRNVGRVARAEVRNNFLAEDDGNFTRTMPPLWNSDRGFRKLQPLPAEDNVTARTKGKGGLFPPEQTEMRPRRARRRKTRSIKRDVVKTSPSVPFF